MAASLEEPSVKQSKKDASAKASAQDVTLKKSVTTAMRQFPKNSKKKSKKPKSE